MEETRKISILHLKEWEQLDGGFGIIRKLQEFGLLASEKRCPRGHVMHVVQDLTYRDGWKWTCRATFSERKQKKKVCGYSETIRRGTFFLKPIIAI